MKQTAVELPKVGTKEFNDSAMEMFGGKPKQQTAVEYYEIEINSLIEKYEAKEISKRDFITMKHNLFYSAKEMEKQQQGYNLEEAIKKTFDKWNEWQKGMPEFDGKYLVLIEQEQECGNVWKYQQVVDCLFNNWVLKLNEKVVGWKKLSPI